MSRLRRSATASPRAAFFLIVACLLALLATSAAHDGDDRKRDFTPETERSIKAVTLVSAALSMLGSGFILFSYCYFKDMQTFAYKLIVFLSAADMLSSMAYFVDFEGTYEVEANPGSTCFIAAGMSQMFDVATFMWTSVIAYNIYQVLVMNKGRATEGNEGWYHAVAWGVPLILCIVAASLKSFGDAGNWCWITEQFQDLRFGLYYIPLMLVLLFNAVLYTSIVRKIRTMNTQAGAVEWKLQLYLLAFFVVRIWSVINRVQNLIAPDRPVYFLYLMHSIFSPIQGLANALVYGLNRKVARHYRICCGRMFPCCVAGHDTRNPLEGPATPGRPRNLEREGSEMAGIRRSSAGTAEVSESLAEDSRV